MRVKFTFIISTILFLNAAFSQQESNTFRFILKLKREVNFSRTSNNKGELENLFQDIKPNKIENLKGNQLKSDLFVVEYDEVQDGISIINRLKNNHSIEYIEQDHIGEGGGEVLKPNDAFYTRQWGLNNLGNFSLAPSKLGADIEMEKAWDIQQGDSNIIVAILDSGAKLDHPEFQGRIWTNKKEIPNNGIDDDNNGFIDDINGWDFANKDRLPTDDHGHGTNVAGIIGANGNNNIGYAGVDWNCKLMNLKVLDSKNSGFYSWWIDAINYAVANGAKVINMSLGGIGFSQALTDAVKNAIGKGVVVVVSMMNANSEVTYYPAAIDGVIAVGSTNADDTRTSPFFWSATSGSSYGTHISVSAPGNYIFGLSYTSNSNFGAYWGGTSQAAPLVSGLASLLLAQDPSRSPSQIKSIIESTSEDQVGNPIEDVKGWDKYYGHGRVNAFMALSNTTNTKNVEDNLDFIVYPNPSDGQFTIKSNQFSGTLSVYDSQGSLILNKKVDGESNVSIELKNEGLFLLVVKNQTEIVTKKILVVK